MGSLKFASTASGWWRMASFCSFKELSTIGSVSRPLFLLLAADRKFNAVNSSTAIQLSNYHLQPTPRAVLFTCHGERRHPVTAGMPSRVNAAQSRSVRMTDVTASSFTSSASSGSSSTVEPEDVLQFWSRRSLPSVGNWQLMGPLMGGRTMYGVGLPLSSYLTNSHAIYIESLP